MTPTRFEQGGVRGFLHQPAAATGEALVLAHGAGSNANAPLLVAMADAFCAAGLTVLRIDLPFRQAGRPPLPATASLDRDGIREAAAAAKALAGGRVFVGGHSYGGRQATMAAAETPEFAERLLLLSYPLHPPRKPEQLRTAHLPQLRTPSLFVHGSRDPFGTIEEMRGALALIPAPTLLKEVEGGSHDLAGRRRGSAETLASTVVDAFLSFAR